MKAKPVTAAGIVAKVLRPETLYMILEQCSTFEDSGLPEDIEALETSLCEHGARPDPDIDDVMLTWGLSVAQRDAVGAAMTAETDAARQAWFRLGLAMGQRVAYATRKDGQ